MFEAAAPELGYSIDRWADGHPVGIFSCWTVVELTKILFREA